jgi:type VI secretion system protein ImpK
MPHIDDPFNVPDATILRPRPGAGRAAPRSISPRSVEADVPPSARLRRDSPELESASDRGQVGLPVGHPAGVGEPEPAAPGLNPLVEAAIPLLVLAGHLRATLQAADVPGIRRHALEALGRFEQRAQSSGVAAKTVIAARYALCATLDEAVLSTPWGGQSAWAQQTLLVTLHREAWGGEKFFEMLRRISVDPESYHDLIELQYLCLAVGFSGKYQVSEGGYAQIAQVRQDTYRRIHEQNGAVSSELAPRWKGVEDRRSRLIRYVPWWTVAVPALALLAIAFTIFHTGLSRLAAPVHAELARVGTDAFTAPASGAPAVGVTLKQLLQPDERNGVVAVEEEGGRTRITLLAANLFPSGGAVLAAPHHETVRRIGAALDRVPGRVLVVGHTDDQPLRSLAFRDNFELSRERAVTVAKLLQPAVAHPARIEWTGVGPSQPRFRPESDPKNRQRNRRVEIVHIPAS